MSHQTRKYVGTYSENVLTGYTTSRLQNADVKSTTKVFLRYILKSPKIEVVAGPDPKVYYENSVYLITQDDDEGFKVAWDEKSGLFDQYYQKIRVKFDGKPPQKFKMLLLDDDVGGWIFPSGFTASEDAFKKDLTIHKNIWVEVTPVGMRKPQIAKFSLAGFNEAFAACGGSLKPVNEKKDERRRKNSGDLY